MAGLKQKNRLSRIHYFISEDIFIIHLGLVTHMWGSYLSHNRVVGYSLVSASPDLLSRMRDFWFGFDGMCAFTIVMGIFVLLRVQELVIVVLWKCFCVSVLFYHQIMSWFHTWTDSFLPSICKEPAQILLKNTQLRKGKLQSHKFIGLISNYLILGVL